MNDQVQETQPSKLSARQFGLKQFLIVSYSVSLLMVVGNFLFPHASSILLFAAFGLMVAPFFVGIFGCTISIVMLLAVLLLSQKENSKKQDDLILIAKMLGVYVGIAIIPPILLGLLFAGIDAIF